MNPALAIFTGTIFTGQPLREIVRQNPAHNIWRPIKETRNYGPQAFAERYRRDQEL